MLTCIFSCSDASSGIGGTHGNSVKNKHLDDGEEEGMEAEEHEVKRLKFNQDGEEDIEDEHAEVHRSSESSSDKSEDANSPSSMSQEANEEDEGNSASARGCEDQGNIKCTLASI